MLGMLSLLSLLVAVPCWGCCPCCSCWGCYPCCPCWGCCPLLGRNVLLGRSVLLGCPWRWELQPQGDTEQTFRLSFLHQVHFKVCRADSSFMSCSVLSPWEMLPETTKGKATLSFSFVLMGLSLGEKLPLQSGKFSKKHFLAPSLSSAVSKD